jgi:hypothetical protein
MRSRPRPLVVLSLGGLLLGSAAGCDTLRSLLPGGGATRSKSTELTAEGHLTAAVADEAEARRKVQEYIDRQKQNQACDEDAKPDAETVCGARVSEDSDPLLVGASELRNRAARHRATAQELLAAEQTACEGVLLPPDDVDDLFRAESLEGVQPLERSVPWSNKPELAGARVSVRFRPGWTVEGVERVISCHIARNRRRGYGVLGLKYSHLLPAGVTAEVRPQALGFEVVLSTNDAFTARVVLEHARVRLAGR